MKCPKCGLENPESGLICDCGYDFRSGKVGSPPDTPSEHGNSNGKPNPQMNAEGCGCLMVLALGVFLMIIYITYDSEKESTPSPETKRTVETEISSEWRSAGGNIWTGVKLHFGPKKMYVGKVVCGNENYIEPYTLTKFRGVKVMYPSGYVEWKDRNAIVAGA